MEEKSIFASILEIISTQLTKTVNVIESKNSKPEKKSEENISRDGTNMTTINFSMNETNNLEELLETTTSYFILLNTKVLTIMIC